MMKLRIWQSEVGGSPRHGIIQFFAIDSNRPWQGEPTQIEEARRSLEAMGQQGSSRGSLSAPHAILFRLRATQLYDGLNSRC
jgi:hypothetical protein